MSDRAIFLSPFEAEAYVEGLRQFEVHEIGSSDWVKQHEKLEKLNLQAHQSAQAHADEYILEACLTFDKIELLVKDMLNTEAWKEFCFPILKDDVSKKNSLKAYFCLYHEATILNLLEVFLYHDHACEALGDNLIEVIDYCMRKLLAIMQRTKQEVDAPHLSAKELAKILNTQSRSEELDRHMNDIKFKLGVSAIACLRFISEHAGKLTVGVMSRILDTHDVPVAIVPLIEYPPWTYRTEDGKWKKYNEGKWEMVEAEDLLKITKTEGQVWIALYWLMCDGEARKRYHFNTFRKEQVLRVRKYLNDVMLDQLPILADVQRYMDELTIMNAPEPTVGAGSALLMQSVPMYREALTKKSTTDWSSIADTMMRDIFSKTPDKDDEDIKRLAEIYDMDGIEEVLGEEPIDMPRGELVVCSFSVTGLDGTVVDELGVDFAPNKDEADTMSATERGEFNRKKLVRSDSKGEMLPVPFDCTVTASLTFTSAKRVDLKTSAGGIALPSVEHICKSPAEAMGKVKIPLGDDCGIPAGKWIQLGSLETDDIIVQVQFGRLSEASARYAATDGENRNKKSLFCYYIKNVFVSLKVENKAEFDLKAAGLDDETVKSIFESASKAD
jgi:hypothetical protein